VVDQLRDAPAEAAGDGHARRVDLSLPSPYGWWPAVLIALVALIDRVETQLVAGVLPLLQVEWGFSDTVAGAIPAAAALAGIIATLPAGYLADRHNRKNLVAVVVALWSVIALGSGLAPTFLIFFLTRVAVGFADVFAQPAVLSLIADKYSPRTRARAYGWQRMAFAGGGPLGALIGAVVGQLLGWRAAFFFVVVPGLVIAWLVYRLHEPRRGAVDREAARQWAEASGQDPAELIALLRPEEAQPADRPATRSLGARARRVVGDALDIVRSSKTIRFVYLAALLLAAGLSGVMFWLPTLFVRVHDLELAQAGALAGAAFMLGVVIGTEVGGRLGARVHGRVSGGRLMLAGLGLGVGSLLYLPAVALDFLGLQVLAVLLASGCLGIALPNAASCVADVVVAARRGRAFALLQVITAIGAALGPLFIGVASDMTGSLVLAIASLLPLASVGGFLVLRARSDYDQSAQRTLLASY
jgi:MFS family permease